MRTFLSEYGMFIAEVIIGTALIAVLFAYTINSEQIKDATPTWGMEVVAGSGKDLSEYGVPVLKVYNTTRLFKEGGVTLRPYSYIKTAEIDGASAIDQVQVEVNDPSVTVTTDSNGRVETMTFPKAGKYTLTFTLTDSRGLRSTAISIVTIEEAV